MRIRPCWSCFAEGPCVDPCDCAKCIDPKGYAEWRNERPDQYTRWLARQAVDHEDYENLMDRAYDQERY